MKLGEAMSELQIPKDQAACKLLAKVCQTQDIETFSKLKDEYFAWSIRSKELHTRIKTRFEADGKLPTLSGLAELEYPFNPDDLEDTVDHYCERTIDGYLSSNLPKHLDKVTESFEDGDYKSLEKKLTECLDIIRSANLNKSLEVRSLQDITDEILSEAKVALITRSSLVTTTGYPNLDNLMLGGYRAENLYVWTGRPKAGKTTYLIHQSLEAWKSNKRVLFLSGEMQAKELALKLVSELSNVPQSSLLNGEITTQGIENVRDIVRATSETLKDYMIKSTISTTTVQDIEALVVQYKPDILYVDSAHLFKPDSSFRSNVNMHEVISQTVQRFKDIAVKHSIPVVTSTHLNRDAGKRTQRRGNQSQDVDESMVSGSDTWSKASTTLFAVQADKDQPMTRKLIMLHNRVGRTSNYLMSFLPDSPGVNLNIIEELNDSDETTTNVDPSTIEGEVESWFS